MWGSILLVLGAIAALWQGSEPKPPVPPQRSVAELLALQPKDIRTPLTSRVGEREAFDAATALVKQTLAQAPGPQSLAQLPAAASAIALFNMESSQALPALLAALDTLAQQPANYQREVLSAAHTLYWKESASRVRPLLAQITTPREFAIAAYVLLRAEDSAQTRAYIRAQLDAVFPTLLQEPRLVALAQRLIATPEQEVAQRPPLVDLLRAPLRPGLPVVFSFQRSNRVQHGMAMVRGSDGRFVRNADGSYFNIAHMTLAMTEGDGDAAAVLAGASAALAEVQPDASMVLDRLCLCVEPGPGQDFVRVRDAVLTG